MIKGLDDDEIEFLDLVDRTKLAADRKKTIEEEIELNDYRNRVASLQEKNLDQKLQSEINTLKPKPVSNNRSSQTKLLKGVVVKKTETRKRKHSDMDNKGGKPEQSDSDKNIENPLANAGDTNCGNGNTKIVEKQGDTKCQGDSLQNDKSNETARNANTGLRCIAILPGMGCYDNSSSDESSDSDQEEEEMDDKEVKIDLLGRKIVKKES